MRLPWKKYSIQEKRFTKESDLLTAEQTIARTTDDLVIVQANPK